MERVGIHRVTRNGNIVGSGILGSSSPLNTYCAYGVINSFGMDFDPVTGKLWNTENGPAFGDEIYLVEQDLTAGGDISWDLLPLTLTTTI